MLEEYSVRVYKIDTFSWASQRKKIKVDKNGCEYISFRIYVNFTEYLLAAELMNKNTKAENLLLRKKRQEVLDQKLDCKFIRINTSDARRSYDTDYDVSKIQAFISKFKDGKIKELDEETKKLKLQLTKQSD